MNLYKHLEKKKIKKVIMNKLVNTAVEIIITFFLLISIVVGVCWLFDSKPDNLYKVWEFLGCCYVVSLLFFLLFGGNKK